MTAAAAPVCRDCGAVARKDGANRCSACGSPRLLRHPELPASTIVVTPVRKENESGAILESPAHAPLIPVV